LIAEHDTFVGEEDPAEDLLDIFNTVAAAKVESYEIQAYQSLIRMADLMEHTKVSRLLNQSLKEEQATLKKVEGFSKKLKPENLGMEEETEAEDETESSSRKAPRGNGSKPRRGRAA
jgi:ferritin-like metal-binding protein YciE